MPASSPNTTPNSAPRDTRCVLKMDVVCPGCGKGMKYHSLVYKHQCAHEPQTIDARIQRRLDRLDAVIAARFAVVPQDAE